MLDRLTTTPSPPPKKTTEQDRDKLPVVGPRRMLAIGGPPYFVDVISEILTVRALFLFLFLFCRVI